MNNKPKYKPIWKYNDGVGATLCIGCNKIIAYEVEDVLYCDKCTQPSERYLKEWEIKERVKKENNE